MTAAIEEVKQYYDSEIEMAMRETGRHHHIFQSLNALIRPAGTVLDIGCGYGQTSRHLSGMGHEVTAVDLSQKRIQCAQKHNTDHRINYIAADITKWDREGEFDFIVMADVLEHIRPDDVSDLMGVLDRCSHYTTKIYVNVPNGEFLEVVYKHKLAKLQIVDEIYSTSDVLALFRSIEFVPWYIRRYSLEYTEYVFVKAKYWENKIVSALKPKH